MAARLEIDELNGPGDGVLTHGVVTLNAGAIDSPNIQVSSRTSIRAGSNAYVKYNKLHFTSLLGASSVSGLTIYISEGQLREGEAIQTNLVPYGTVVYAAASYSPPTAATYVGYAMPPVGAQPASPNLGINGALNGSLTTTGYSDIWKWQLQTTNSIARGPVNTKVFKFVWNET